MRTVHTIVDDAALCVETRQSSMLQANIINEALRSIAGANMHELYSNLNFIDLNFNRFSSNTFMMRYAPPATAI